MSLDTSISIQKTNKTSIEQTANIAKTCTSYGSRKVQEFWDEAQKPGVAQNIIVAAGRTLTGVYSIQHCPGTVAAAGIAGILAPKPVKALCDTADSIITGVWHHVPLVAKVAVPVIGVGIACGLGYSGTVFTTLGTFFAAKLGAELGARNIARENVNQATEEARQAHDFK